jgi:ferrous iron transport protein A
MMPLGLLNSGDQAEIREIRTWADALGGQDGQPGSIDEESRLKDMGIRIGKTVQMLHSSAGGVLLVKIDESRIAMSRGMALKVLVERRSS